MRCTSVKVMGIMTILVLIGSLAFAAADNYCPVPAEEVVQSTEPANPTNSRDGFGANVKVFVTEIASRWEDGAGHKYHYGFLDFALNVDLDMGYQETYYDTIRWDGVSEGFGVIADNNIQVFAAVYDLVPAYVSGDPPNGAMFWSELAVASAAATPYEYWPDTARDHYSHNVFCEEITATW